MCDEVDETKKLLSELESHELSEVTKSVINSLTPSEAKVLRERFRLGKGVSIEDLTKSVEVTRERILAIEEKALSKLRNRNPNDDDPSAA